MTDREKLLLWCIKYCNNPNLVDEEDFSLVLDRLGDVTKQAGISSESLGDYSVSFSKETAYTIRDMLSPYKRLKLL